MYGLRPQRRLFTLGITGGVFLLCPSLNVPGISAREIVLPDIVVPGYRRNDIPLPEDFTAVGLNWMPLRPRTRRIYPLELEGTDAAWVPALPGEFAAPRLTERGEEAPAPVSGPPRREEAVERRAGEAPSLSGPPRREPAPRAGRGGKHEYSRVFSPPIIIQWSRQ